MSDLLSMSLTEAAAAVAAKHVSAVELTRACLARIETWQPKTNAFIALEAEVALAAAATADDILAKGGPIGPLHGVPMAHKDMYYRPGRVTSCGSKVRADFVPTHVATVLARLDAAGALDLGRLNMSEFALGPTGINAHYGRAKNPWDPDRVTGGSSSGSGAAVGSGMVFGALGSDTGGSIRLPSALCGIAGLKPTQGRVSRYGVMPLSFSQDCVGPMAPTVADVALMYGVIAGADPHDPTASRRAVTAPAARTSLKGVTLGFCDAWAADLDAETTRALTEAKARVVSLGAVIKPVDLPDPLELGEFSNIVAMTEAASIHADWLRERAQDYGDQVRARLRQGMVLPAPLYLRAIQMRGALLERFVAAFDGCDALMLPVVPFVPPLAAAMDGSSAGSIPGMVAAMARFTRPINYLGLPALAQPTGWSSDQLPLAMQLVGRPFDEATILAIGMAFERAGVGSRRLP